MLVKWNGKTGHGKVLSLWSYNIYLLSLLGRPLIIVSSSVAIYNVFLYEGIGWLTVNLFHV